MYLKVFYLLLTIINVNYAHRIVCYWFHQQSNDVRDFDPQLCTHFHYSFATLDSTSLLIKFENSWDENVVKQINGYKAVNPKLKIILALGGDLDSTNNYKFSRMANNSQSRAGFVKQSIQFLKKYSFDGLNLDWEYPVCPDTNCNAGHTYDKDNFAKLIEELRVAFDKQTPKLSLSAAVNPHQLIAEKAYKHDVLNSSLDYVNVMTYGRGLMLDNMTGHHSSLEESTNSLNWWATKIDKSKLLMGVPFYGISFRLKNSEQHGMGEPAYLNGRNIFFTICIQVKKLGWKKVFIHSQGPYAYNSKDWIGYDDTINVMKKGQWVRENGFGGLSIWEIDQDDIHGMCCGTDKPLLRAANYGLLQNGKDPNTFECEQINAKQH